MMATTYPIGAAAAAAVLALLGLVAAQGSCPSHTSCKDCIGSPFCGWCSPGRIMFDNGTVGARCADQRDKAAWTCDGIYQTDECIMGYSCEPPPKVPNYTCVKAGLGEGSSNASCTAGCGKAATIYGCDNKTWTCKAVPGGTAGAAGLSVCNKTCAPYAKCNSATWTCDKATPGTPGALPAGQCASSCHDASKYSCSKNYTCEVSSLPFGLDKKGCEDMCHTPKPEPVTPQSLLGLWRGIQINTGFLKGEWVFNFEKASVQVTAPNDATKSWKATVSTLQDPATGRQEVWLVLQSGPDSGKTVKALYEIGPNGPETQHLLLACGEPDVASKALAPKDFDTPMGGAKFGEFLLSQCSEGAPSCSFRPPTTQPAYASWGLEVAGRRLATAQDDPADACNIYKTCSTCITHSSQCGWCSVNVVYNDTSKQGAQCAGFDKQGKPSPSWHCPSHYSRTDCSDYVCDQKTLKCREALPGDQPPFITKDFCETELCKPVKNTSQYSCSHDDWTCHQVPHGTPGASPTIAGCNSACKKPKPVPGYQCSAANNWTCAHIADGGVPSKTVCDASCKKPQPANHTPSGLLGSWRGIAIQNGYATGEWDAKINKSFVQFTDTKGKTWEAVTGAGGGADLTFTVTTGINTGKTIACLFTSASGPETVRMTLAMGVPATGTGAKPPTSYDDALKTGQPVLVLAKCGGKPYCAFP